MNIKKIIGKSSLGKKLVKQKSKKDVQNYWKNPDDPEYNSPQAYLESKTKNTKILVDIFNQYFPNKNIKILELGCNVGRNLNQLFDEGFKDLYAIEINAEAIELMKKSFPNTFSSTNIFNSPIEDTIKKFVDNEFDVVFSMAVLMHIHYDSNWIFEHIARITKRYLITMENEQVVAKKIFPEIIK